MRFIAICSTALGVIGRATATALPANATNAVKSSFTAPFYGTADNQVFCENIQMADTGSNYARRADCEGLVNMVRSVRGYWDVSNWGNTAEEILENGTCHLRISRSDGGNGHVWIGNQDFGHFIGPATNLAHGGLMGVMGAMTCSHPDGNSVQVIMSVMA